MLKHEQEFAEILKNDFNLPLISQTEDAYFDSKPDAASYTKPLDRMNEIYRYSIGQQKPYQFIKVVEWYSRIAAGKKVLLNYKDRERLYENISLPSEELSFLKETMNGVLRGTAANVGNGLSQNSVRFDNFIAKTGTAESASKQFNSSSSFIISNNEYTIGIMLDGKIPYNSQNLAAKDLMISTIPILKKYNIL
jgi:cell division protein FtsI/penicillin-binding protein 2